MSLLRPLQVYLSYNTKKDWQFYREASQKMFVSKLTDEYRNEMSGIASGLQSLGYKYDLLDIIALNAYIELSEYYLPSIQSSGERRRPLMRCSAFMATGKWTRDGKIVMGHNSWNDYIIGQKWNVIIDIIPTEGHRIKQQTAPGFIHSGTDFVVNSEGIVITETTIGNFAGYNPNGIPEFQRARRAAQYSSSIDEFYAIMREGNNGGYANTWLVGDIHTNEIAKVELGLINVAFYRSKDGYYHGENYVDDSKMILDEVGSTLWQTAANWPFNLTNANTITARSLRWHALMAQNKGKIDTDLAKTFLGDQIEQVTGKFTPGGYVLMARMEMTDRPEIPGAVAPRPFGANEGKVLDAKLASEMSFWARMGHPDGSVYNWTSFWVQHPSFAWQAPFLPNLIAHQWNLFRMNATE